MLFDIHSHLDICEEKSLDIENATKKGVKIVSCGINPLSNRRTLEIKKESPQVEICLGVYPSDALKLQDKEIKAEIEFIRKHNNKIIGIGEVGMDLKENDITTLAKQKEILKKFVNLAKELGKPVVIHSRKAEEECVQLLEGISYKKIIMHCFSGNFKLIKRIIENGWIITIPTSVKNSEHFQKVIEVCPIENLLCETDSPFLHPDRKFPNEPANVIEAYKKIAEIKKIPIEEAEKMLEINYANFFK